MTVSVELATRYNTPLQTLVEIGLLVGNTSVTVNVAHVLLIS